MPADVDAALPQLDLAAFTILTVTLDDPAAVITQLVVHGWQTVPELPEPVASPLPFFVPVPADEAT